METFGHHTNTKKGREILRSFGEYLNLDKSRVETEFQIKSVGIRIPDQKDVDGRIRRPYLDMNVEITGMVIDNEGTDTVRFGKDDRLKSRYRYELDDFEMGALISRGLYRDRHFERDLGRTLENRTFVELTTSTIYSNKFYYEGAEVPFVVLDGFEALPIDYAEGRDVANGLKGFSLTLDDAFQFIDRADQLAANDKALARGFDMDDHDLDSDRSIAIMQMLEKEAPSDDFSVDIDVDSSVDVDGQDVIEESVETEPFVGRLAETLVLPEEVPSIDEVVIEPASNVKSSNDKPLKTLSERRAELEAQEAVVEDDPWAGYEAPDDDFSMDGDF